MNIHSLSPFAQIAAGLLLVFFGRKLFWIFVGIVGFLVGIRFGSELARGQPEIMLLLIAVGIGLVGAILAVVLERVAIALAGALSGGLLALRVAEILGVATAPTSWVTFLIGAVLAAVLVSLLFDWALIVLSALMGATLLAEAVPLNQSMELLAVALLAMAGILVQARLLRLDTGSSP